MASKSHFPELGNNPSVVSACCGRTKNVHLMSINAAVVTCHHVGQQVNGRRVVQTYFMR